MKYSLKHMIWLCFMLLLVLTACETWEADNIVVPDANNVSEETVQIEVFTRADSYDLPTLRSLANENGLEMTPWVLVFKETGGSFVFEEAVQAIEITGINKRYVNLTQQSARCKLLILANLQNSFSVQENITSYTTYASSVENFKTILTGKTLEQATAVLCTLPLNSPQRSIPFSNNEMLPMSYLLDLDGGINDNTQIGTTVSPIELIRAVAKIVVKSKPSSDFTFEGITLVGNAPKAGLLHRLSGINPPDNEHQGLVEYNADDGYVTDIISAESGSTGGSPIYLYESKPGTDSDTYIIIRAKYKGRFDESAEEYFYKLEFVDSDSAPMSILRNHLYTFTIESVYGRGFSSIDDAITSKASNSNINLKITVTDEYSYEIEANNDYYLGVSNSLFIAYHDSDQDQDYKAFTLITNCGKDFPYQKTMTTRNKWWEAVPGYTSDFFLIDDTNNTLHSMEIPIVGYTNPEIYDVKIRLPSGMETEAANYVSLKLGNLEKNVYVRRYPSIAAAGATFSVAPYWGSADIFLSGEVVDEYSNNATDWIKLRPIDSNDNIIYGRDDTDKITVDNGLLKIEIAPNTGPERQGVVFLTTINDSFDVIPVQSIRIKVDIHQKGM